MSWVTPPGIACLARSTSDAALGCFARYSSWIVIARSYLWPPGGGVEQLDDPGVDLGTEAVDGRLALARDPVDRARFHAARDELTLDGAGVEQQATVQTFERGDDSVGAPVRGAGHDQVIGGHDAGDLGHERAHAREPGARGAHADLVAAIADRDRHGTGRPGLLALRAQGVGGEEEVVEWEVPLGDGLA